MKYCKLRDNIAFCRNTPIFKKHWERFGPSVEKLENNGVGVIQRMKFSSPVGGSVEQYARNSVVAS